MRLRLAALKMKDAIGIATDLHLSNLVEFYFGMTGMQLVEGNFQSTDL